jgi:hypothetical protein
MKTTALLLFTFGLILSSCAYVPARQEAQPAQDPMYGCNLKQRDLTSSWAARAGDWCVTSERPVAHVEATNNSTNAEFLDEF